MRILSSKNLPIKSVLHYFTTGVVVIPTETVYGLAAPINNDKLLLDIFKIKNRPADNPLIVHVNSLDMLKTVIDGEIPSQYRDIIDKFWPGPISLLFAANKNLSKVVTAGLDTVLVRMPDNKVILDIIEELGIPLAAPSANLSGKPSPSCIEHTIHDFGESVELYIDDGPCRVGLESTVFSFFTNEDPIILRPGGICKEDLEAVIGRPVILKNAASEADTSPISPGLKYKHYSPRNKFIVLLKDTDDILNDICEHVKDKQVKIGILMHINTPCNKRTLETVEYYELGSTMNETASNLYKGLRHLDNTCDIIFMYKLPSNKEGEAIMDRILKAAHSIVN